MAPKLDENNEENGYMKFILTGLLMIITILGVWNTFVKGGIRGALKKIYLSSTQFKYTKYRSLCTLMANSESFDFLDDIELANKILSYPQSKTVFLGKPGSGKTRFFQRILRKWGNGKILQEYTLIFFQLDYRSKQDCSWHELAQKVDCSVGDIKSMLHRKSILILDGMETTTLQTCRSMPNTSPLQALLQNNFVTSENMKIWIGCREIEDDISDIGPVVYFKGLKKEQVKNMFMEIVFRKHSHIPPKSVCKIYDEYTKDDPATELLFPLMSWLLALSYLNSNSEDVMKRIIKIIFKFCSNDYSDRHVDIDYLMEFGYWDLLACLLEAYTQDEEKYTNYVKMFQMKQVKFSHVDEDYPRQAICHLFQTMKEKKVEITSVQFCSLSPTFLRGVPKAFPKVEKDITFCEVKLKEPYFHSLIESISESCENIRVEFVESQLPEDVWRMPKVGNITVIKKKNDVEYSLDLNTGSWNKFNKENSRNLFQRCCSVSNVSNILLWSVIKGGTK